MSGKSCWLALALALSSGAESGAQTARPAEVGASAMRAAAGRLEPGDRIVTHVVGERTDTVMVTERGEAAFDKIGMMNVGQLTIAQLQDTLRKELARYLRSPALEIIVLRRVAVNGEVKMPDVYLVDVSTTLRDVVAMAGGITETGNRKKVYLVRGGERTLVPDWETTGGFASDLRSGDQVIVGRLSWWSINALPAVSAVVVMASLLITVAK